MIPPDGRTALDLLDAHLETLWGTWEPSDVLPAEPPGLAAEGAGELVHWALDRLRNIPREPKDAFAREIGDLIMEFRSRRSPWNAAALRLLYDQCIFVATGPRRHEDWTHDVHAVLHRTVNDPRGWLRLDMDCPDPARQTVPAYPFDPPAPADMRAHLHPLEAQAAVAALAVMAEEWQSEQAPVRSRPDREALLADARLLLDRYGPGAHYWTNATAAASTPAPDFLASGLEGTSTHRFHTTAYIAGLDIFEDLGVIAVNDEEVGVFWSIGAY
ncbi:hypothetical protein [Streptomyces sp. CL12-4]|uniref:hypothetical protein n=1 Tax=Streptomyces sp. CL12-4 TaxID=2810306 RepID=UPI001EFB2BFA|nr:hypothetical protein [Streptomyces sp. CL12-4]MCG8969119.1 hypothetical protein [Streptomyces sp. CL12-4]